MEENKIRISAENYIIHFESIERDALWANTDFSKPAE